MARVWADRIWLAAAAAVVLAILGFYASRLSLPAPLFASDEASYLIQAIYPPEIAVADPFVSPVINGVHLSVIRAVYRLGAPVIIGDRLVDAAAYLGGILLLWHAGKKGLPRREQIALLLIAVGFPYYRFAFSNLAEGLYVGVLAALCVATGRWYRSRPLVHAVAAGGLAAALVLVKPNGAAVIAALAAVAVLDAAASAGWRRLPLRLLLFAMTFLVAGNLMQFAAEEPMDHPLAFFVGDLYRGDLAMTAPPHVAAVAALALGSMTSAMALLAGAPLLVGVTDLAQRWRARRGRFQAEGADLVFLLLALSAATTLLMVAVFATKVASTPGETKRLWGRYFEFFVPMLWLAAAPALARPVGRRLRWACAAVMLAGLAGLLVGFRAGIVLFPWDASVLTAFFRSDPVRAPLGPTPYRALAIGASLLAAAAMALKLRPTQAGLGLVLALGALSTDLDWRWLGPLVRQRAALERDIRAIRPILPPEPAPIVLLAPDANDGHLGFFLLDARPRVWLGPPGGQVPPGALFGVEAVVVSGPETPPEGPWVRTFQGQELSLFRRQPGSPKR